MSSNLYQDALDVQDACNLCAVVIAFGKLASKLFDQCPPGTSRNDFISRHPVFVLWLDKIMDLSHYDRDELSPFSRAYDECRRLAAVLANEEVKAAS